MAIPTTPNQAEVSPANNVTPVQVAITPLVANQTNTATSATQVTGLTLAVPVINPLGDYVRVTLSADSLSNSAANNVIITLWAGTVGTGTQLAQETNTAQSGAKAGLSTSWIIPIVSTAAINQTAAVTLNIGMHGSGAGTNTMVGSSTAPIFFAAEVL